MSDAEMASKNLVLIGKSACFRYAQLYKHYDPNQH